MCVEKKYKPHAVKNWKLGEDIIIGMDNMRDFANPKNSQRYLPKRQPNTYQGQHWTDMQNIDGQHINAGIITYWFYLLVNGGSGTNDHGTAYSVQGIGIDKAAKIFQRMLILSFPESGYIMSANYSLLAAHTLHGLSSNEWNQVRAAWAAVGISLGVTIAGPDFVPCNSNGVIFSTPNNLSTPTWTVSSNLEIVGGNITRGVTVKAKQGTSGIAPGTVTASFIRNNVSYNASKTVAIHPPTVTSITGPSTVQTGSSGSFTASPVFPTTQGSYEWFVNPSTGTQFAGSGYTCNITFNTPGTYTVYCRSRNNCSSPGSYNASKTVTVGSGYYSAIVPNNSKLVNITYSAKPGSTLSKQTVDYSLTNPTTGRIVSTGHLPATGGTLDFSAQPAGIYILQITTDKGEVETFKLVLK